VSLLIDEFKSIKEVLPVLHQSNVISHALD